MNCKNKSFMTKKKAFTLIELLIVIAIIGILFIVLVSKVDFATDKAKATGVQTDFRSFQMAFDTVAKENAGFNTFGWDTGDANQNGKRDSYDEGDNGDGGGIAKNGIQDGTEVFTGHKVYDETFTKVFSLKKNGTGSYDRDALNRLETAINANLDPKLHITIKDDGEIVMANGAQDPWNKEYHGWYITNAENDGKDRGAIVLYSDGANNEFGSAHSITGGKVTVTVPNSNKYGKDDYSIVSIYSYVNGYGEVLNITTGFSNNQSLLSNGSAPSVVPGDGGNNAGGNAGGNGSTEPDVNEPIPVVPGATFNDGTTLTWEEVQLSENGDKYGYDASAISDTDIGEDAFYECSILTSVVIPDGVTTIGDWAFDKCTSLTSITIPYSVTTIGEYAFYNCTSLTSITIPYSVTSIGDSAFMGCTSLTEITVSENNESYKSIDGNLYTKDGKTLIQYTIGKTDTEFTIPSNVTTIGYKAFDGCSALTSIVIPDSVTTIDGYAFGLCYSLSSVTIGNSVTSIGNNAFDSCENLTSITYRGTVSQWSAISLGSFWDAGVPATYVQCFDGQVNI